MPSTPCRAAARGSRRWAMWWALRQWGYGSSAPRVGGTAKSSSRTRRRRGSAVWSRSCVAGPARRYAETAWQGGVSFNKADRVCQVNITTSM
jgi:hypothetical protein